MIAVRYETINACAHLVWRLHHNTAVHHMRDEGDIIVLHLADGTDQMIHIHFIDRALSRGEVLAEMNENTARGIYTLYLFWAEMLLPSHNMVYPVDDWMIALAELHGGHIYGYEVAGRDAWFFPVYVQGDQPERLFHYGVNVDYARLGGYERTFNTPHLNGTWKIAGFNSQRHAWIPEEPAHPLAAAFDLLGIPIHSDAERVKRAYRQLARRFHPDLNLDEDTHKQMQAINAAYGSIMDFIKESTSPN